MPPPRLDPLVSLITDFGTRDHYAGVMRAVIAGICPQAHVIDVTHEVEPFQIRQAGYLLAQSWRWFPAGTVHVAVVDPGVGSGRRALAAFAHGHFFVLPDNGLLGLAGLEQPLVREIQNPAWMLPAVSRTFQGRDLFAPAAAHLTAGVDFDAAGPLVEDWVRLARAPSSVLHVDRFGNVVTNISADPVDGPVPAALRIAGTDITRHATHYNAAPYGELFVIGGSSGYLEISEREASAAARLGCRAGDPVTPLPADRS